MYGSVKTSFTGGSNYVTLKGVNVGRNRLNAGIGADIYSINKSSKLFSDYEFDLGERSTAHTIQLSFITTR